MLQLLKSYLIVLMVQCQNKNTFQAPQITFPLVRLSAMLLLIISMLMYHIIFQLFNVRCLCAQVLSRAGQQCAVLQELQSSAFKVLLLNLLPLFLLRSVTPCSWPMEIILKINTMIRFSLTMSFKWNVTIMDYIWGTFINNLRYRK